MFPIHFCFYGFYNNAFYGAYLRRNTNNIPARPSITSFAPINMMWEVVARCRSPGMG
jgi:hypothetical protein